MKPSIMDVLAGPKVAPQGGRVVRNLGEPDLRGNRGERWEATPARLANAAKARAVLAGVRKVRDAELWASRKQAITEAIGGRRLLASEVAYLVGLDSRVVRDLLNEMHSEGALVFELVPAPTGGPAARCWYMRENGHA